MGCLFLPPTLRVRLPSLTTHFGDGRAHKDSYHGQKKCKLPDWPLMTACLFIPHHAHSLVLLKSLIPEHVILSVTIIWASSFAWDTCCSFLVLLPSRMLPHQESECSPTSLLPSSPHLLCFMLHCCLLQNLHCQGPASTILPLTRIGVWENYSKE